MSILSRMADPHHAPNWWQDLLRAWAPSGSPLSDDRQLRLAIRDGYLNFYHKGQSVAKVCFGRGGTAQLKIHIKYVSSEAKEQRYARLVHHDIHFEDGGTATVLPYRGESTLREWVKRADKHAGWEKRGVECIVASNQNVVDLEMGIPSWPEQACDARTPERTTRFAPRMDLVALEATHNGGIRVVFWEGKTLRDGRLRSAKQDPEALRQLCLYKSYLAREQYRTAVAEAYRDTCATLIELHCMAATIGGESGIPPLGALIVKAASEAPLVDTEPRLIVFAAEKEGDFENEPKGWAKHYALIKRSCPVLFERDPRMVILNDMRLQRDFALPAETVELT